MEKGEKEYQGKKKNNIEWKSYWKSDITANSKRQFVGPQKQLDI